MTNSIVFDVLAVAAAIFVLWLLLKVFRGPLKLLFKLLINTGFGFVSLFILNMLCDYTGVLFEINFVTSAIVGILGLPGILLLLIFKLYL
ncbi:MAG: pro-sigmaK processing inhibitor BofA family protein [Eubacteriales bacterium]|nr:pro-sigmaK processing inhibitor BofA family protein [Eubacteriales bacterium]